MTILLWMALIERRIVRQSVLSSLLVLSLILKNLCIPMSGTATRYHCDNILWQHSVTIFTSRNGGPIWRVFACESAFGESQVVNRYLVNCHLVPRNGASRFIELHSSSCVQLRSRLFEYFGRLLLSITILGHYDLAETVAINIAASTAR